MATQQQDYQSDLKKILKTLGGGVQTKQEFKKRFVVKIGDHIKTISIDDIHLFYSQDKTTFVLTNEGRNFIVDFPLDRLVELVDPKRFFRISRKYIICLDAIDDMLSFSNSRLKLVVKHYDDENIIVARERVQEFKQWLDQ